MDKFVAQFAHEWSSGSIRYQNMYKRDRPWASVKKLTAYDLSQGKYKEFSGTINLLVENYLNTNQPKSTARNIASHYEAALSPSKDSSSSSNSISGSFSNSKSKIIISKRTNQAIDEEIIKLNHRD